MRIRAIFVQLMVWAGALGLLNVAIVRLTANSLPRQVLRADLGCDDLEWERGRAWAFEQAMGLVWYYRDSNPAMSSGDPPT